MRMGEDIVVKKVIKSDVSAKRRRGCPKGKWMDAGRRTLKVSRWGEKSSDRRQWKEVVHKAMVVQGLES